MSRIGKAPIAVPDKVSVEVNNQNEVLVKGPLGELSWKVNPDLKVNIEDSVVTVERPTEQKRHKALHGLYRMLIYNMVKGVSQGYTTSQELVGVGYRAAMQGQMLKLTLGYSHEVMFELPKEINAEVVIQKGKNPIINLKSIDKQLIGQVAAKIRSLRPPEPYKGKGIKFVGERLRRKAGKAASK